MNPTPIRNQYRARALTTFNHAPLRTALLTCALLVAANAQASDPPAGDVAEQDGALVVRRGGAETGRLILPARARQIVLRGDLALVALGPAGLWIVDVSDPGRPVVAARLAEGKDVVGVLLGQGAAVHVVEASYAIASYDLADPKAPRALAFSAAAAAPQAGTVAPPASAPARIEGRVLQVKSGRAIVDRGSADGLAIGARIQVLSQEPVERPNLSTGATELVPSDEPVAVLEIDVIDQHRASAPLHRGDRCRSGDRFVTTSEPPSERLFMPPRQDYAHRLTVTFRPIIELGTLGLGSISDVRYGYHFDMPLAIEVGATPLAFEVRRGEAPRQYPTAVDVTALYDTDFFAVGLGAGGLIYSPHEVNQYAPDVFTPTRVTTGSTSFHFALAQAARLGNVDGLSLEVRNMFVYRTSEGATQAAFHWGSTDVHGNVPLTRRLTLTGGGGGGDNGWGYGELGVRAYFKGTGGAGTVIVPMTVGIGGFTRGDSNAGPLLSIGIELRR
jgi:hypothetical protein